MKVDVNYKKWVVGLKAKIRSAQVKAAVAVNRELLELYWEIGREICEKQKMANWGDGLIGQLSKDLSAAFPGVKGFSRANLFYIRQWYMFYQGAIVKQAVAEIGNGEKVEQVVRLLPWGHNVLIIKKCKSVDEALFYVRETIRNHWSRAVLSAQIESGLFKRQGKAIDNFSLTLPETRSDLVRETLKNPYNFDFLMLGKDARERDLETALTNHIQRFILELGQGFAYMGKQYPLNVGGDDFFLDLLFYHTRLRCYVVIELKIDEFKPEYVGKLNFYLNAVNAQLRHPQDQRSIGILLCKTPNKVVVEYSLQEFASPLGVAEYQIASAVPVDLRGELPSIEELEQELEGISVDVAPNVVFK